MISLVANLKTKDPFYVRCVKPNEIKSPVKFNDERCLHQVRGGREQAPGREGGREGGGEGGGEGGRRRRRRRWINGQEGETD